MPPDEEVPDRCPGCNKPIHSFPKEEQMRCRVCDQPLACLECWTNAGIAIATYDRHLKAEHSKTERIFELCREAAVEMAKKKFELSLAFYRKALEIDPKNPEPWYGCGVTYTTMEEYEKAADAYRKALAANPEHKYARNGLKTVEAEFRKREADEEGYLLEKGAKWLAKAKYERAKAIYKELIDKYPGNAEAFNALGLIYGHLGDIDRSLRYFQACLKRFQGDFSGLYANRGLILMKFERFDEAIESFECGLEDNDEILQLWYNLGVATYQTEEYARALDAFDRAIALNDQYYMAWYSKAMALQQLGRTKEAQEAFATGYRLNPKYSLNFVGKQRETTAQFGEHQSDLAATITETTTHPDTETDSASGFEEGTHAPMEVAQDDDEEGFTMVTIEQPDGTSGGQRRERPRNQPQNGD